MSGFRETCAAQQVYNTRFVFYTCLQCVLIFIILADAYIYIEREISAGRQKKPEYLQKWSFDKTKENLKPSAIVHIGAHKVASSYIQSRMCNDSDTLIGFGLALPVPTQCNCTDKIFASIAFELQGRKEHGLGFTCSKDPVDDFGEFLHQNKSFFISSEEFDNLDERGVKQLKKLLTNFDTKIVVFYRSKLHHLLSYFSQIYKGGKNMVTFQEFLFDQVLQDDHGDLKGLFYSDMLQLYSAFFGANNVFVLCYDGMLSHGIDPWDGLLMSLFPEHAKRVEASSQKRINDFEDPLRLSSMAVYNQFASISLNSSDMIDLKCAAKLESFAAFDNNLRQMCSSLSSLAAPWMINETRYFIQLGIHHTYYFDGFDDQVLRNASSLKPCFHTSAWNSRIDAKLKSQMVKIREEKIALC
jgi:hypothetical protein